MDEFEIIQSFFTHKTPPDETVHVGIGDDAALIDVPQDQRIVITTDTLVAGTHFSKGDPPRSIGYKALAVNLSDLAAMGAKPAWVTLALTLPFQDVPWLEAFSEGFFSLAKAHRVTLVGGDMTRGPLSITVQAIGLIPAGTAALKRAQAQVGDYIYVSGTLGDAGAGLKLLQRRLSHPSTFYARDQLFLIDRLHYPSPRVELGIALRNIANAAIDISDGLVADLNHIVTASKVGANINVEAIPLSAALSNSISPDEAIELALGAGDDYELCFTVPSHKVDCLNTLTNVKLTQIGKVTDSLQLTLQDKDGKPYETTQSGYKHF